MVRAARIEDGASSEDVALEDAAPHPRFVAELFGHAAAEDAFLRTYRAGRLHHAWLLTGERGIGKATFAWRTARFLLTGSLGSTLSVPENHPVARQLASGAHPSLFVLGKGDGASIGVDEARKLRAFLGLTSPGGGWRVVIVDAVNDLTISSTNALLKGIEEPPPRTIFFLVSQGATAVPATIRSRCIRRGLRPLNPEDMRKAVANACRAAYIPEPDESILAKLALEARGSPGRALSLLREGSALQEKLDLLLARLPKLDGAAAHELVRRATGPKNAAAFTELCELIEERLEALARQEGGRGGGAGWAAIWASFRERRLELETLNLDKGAFLLAAFSDMQSVYSHFSDT
jgi:DNA polymerase-3 subunit delta'